MEPCSIYGQSGSPIAIPDEKGNSAVLNAVDNFALEWLARGLTVKMGGSSHIAEYAMSGKDVKRTAVRNCVSLVLKIGRTIREAAEKKESPLEALMRVTEGTNYGKAIPLFKGKILDVERRTTAACAGANTA